MSRADDRLSGWRYAALIAGYLAACVVLDWVSDVYPVAAPLAITPWNPVSGLGVALLLRYGLHNAPWLVVGAVLAEVLGRGPHAPWPLFAAVVVLPALVYTSLAAVLRGALRFRPDFATLRDATTFVIATTIATAVLAAAFAEVLAGSGALNAGSLRQGVAHLWIGDLIGIIVLAPVLLVLTRRPWVRSRVSAAEAAAQLAAIAAALWVVFASGWAEELKLFYVLFLPLIWIAMRGGVEATVIATALIQFGLIAVMRAGNYPVATVLEFQVLLIALALTGLALGVTVTERAAMARQLREREQELDRSLRLAGASEMASALAHELNQPLAAIGTYVRACQLMLAHDGSTAEALRETMAKVTREVTRAGDVLHRLRDFFRTGSGQPDRVDIAQLLNSVIGASRARAERHNVELRLELPAWLPAVRADRIHVEIVLHNLVSNAIDALNSTAAGERIVTLSAVMENAQFVSVGVTDSGPGVAPEMRAQLFEPFATSKPHGMGLGLPISRSLVEAGGGRLWHEHAGQGSSFRFTLPVARTTS